MASSTCRWVSGGRLGVEEAVEEDGGEGDGRADAVRGEAPEARAASPEGGGGVPVLEVSVPRPSGEASRRSGFRRADGAPTRRVHGPDVVQRTTSLPGSADRSIRRLVPEISWM